MAPKNVKMDLSSFLADDTFGGSSDSWADDFDPTVLQNNNGTIDLGFAIPSQEASIPENPPYTARISSFPQQTTEDDIRDFFWNNLALIEQDVEDFYCPKDVDGSLKNFAFITFSSRELLVDALTLNDKPIHGKPVYVSVAKPSKNQRAPRQSRFGGSNDDFEWGSARGSRSAREPREFREPREPRAPRDDDFEWGAARGSKVQPEPQQRSFRENREPREPRAPRNDDFEWGAARGSKVQPEPQQRSFREHREPREPREPRNDDFEWGAARGSKVQPEPQQRPFRENREPREPRAPKTDDFEWGAARGSKIQPEVRKTTPKPTHKPKTDDFEWGSRGSMLKEGAKKATSNTSNTSTKTPTNKSEQPIVGPKKSLFSVLQTEDDEEGEEGEEEKKEQSQNVDDVTKAASELSLQEENGWTIKK